MTPVDPRSSAKPAERTAGLRGAGASVAAALMTLIAATACSGSGGPAASTPTSAPCSTGAGPTSGAPDKTVVPVDGSGDRNVGLPADLTPPLIVHAHRDGTGTFVVRGIDVSGKDTQVLASALGAYDGTFAVGFVDDCATPTVGLHVESTGRWHLDIADARLAHGYDTGVAGKGDSVLSYLGTATKARVTYAGHARFNVTTYGADGPKLLARSTGAYRGTVSLPRGPIFIAVTADGAWTIEPS
jgi:hypothetical protein